MRFATVVSLPMNERGTRLGDRRAARDIYRIRPGRYFGSRFRPGPGLAPVRRLPMQASASATAPATAAAVSVQRPAAVASAACAAGTVVAPAARTTVGAGRG
jgi:hypothetical protein